MDATHEAAHHAIFGVKRCSRDSIIIATERVTWFLLLSPPLRAPENMALDEALMARARRTGQSVFRVYGWERPALSLGRNQRAAGVYREERLATEALDVVRRPTGGRALLHDREVTYSVTAPIPDGEPLGASYARINALLLDGLARLGVAARAWARTTPAESPSPVPCFARPAAGELVFAGRKLVGSAQWRDRGALLQHGSILLDDDQGRIAPLMREPAAEVPPPATLRDALGRAPVNGEVAAALFAAVHSLADPRARALELDEESRRAADALAERYRDDAWTWRR